jgi:hypothetical protein
VGSGLIVGIAAVLVAGGLAVTTAVGLVNQVNTDPKNTDASVVQYGSKS